MNATQTHLAKAKEYRGLAQIRGTESTCQIRQLQMNWVRYLSAVAEFML